MQRIRTVRADGNLTALCVMRRSHGDERIVGGMAFDQMRPYWNFRPGNHSGHTTPTGGYDTIVFFTNGAVGMIQDAFVDQALEAIGLREVRR